MMKCSMQACLAVQLALSLVALALALAQHAFVLGGIGALLGLVLAAALLPLAPRRVPSAVKAVGGGVAAVLALYALLWLVVAMLNAAASPLYAGRAFPPGCVNSQQEQGGRFSNCVRIVADNSSVGHDQQLSPLVLASGATCTDVFSVVVKFIDDTPRAHVVAAKASPDLNDGFLLHANFVSLLMAFIDDLAVECVNSQLLRVHSESRVGVGDVGVNLERVERLIDALQDASLLADEEGEESESIDSPEAETSK